MSIHTTNSTSSNTVVNQTLAENNIDKQITKSTATQFASSGGIIRKSYVEVDDLLIQQTNYNSASNPQTNKLIEIGMTSIGWERIGDDSIRNLMKEIIKAFAALITNQKEADRNALESMLKSFDEKIKQMGEAQQKAFQSAMAGAICGMMAGAVSIVCGAIGLHKLSHAGVGEAAQKAATKVSDQINSIGGTIGKIIESSGGIMSAVWTKGKEGANIEVAKQERLVEVFNSMHDENKKFSENMMQFINNILSEMQQLLNAVASSGRSIAQA